MAQVGMKYLVAAPVNEGGGYDTGMIIARAINADVSLTFNKTDFWSDDAIEDSVNEFGGGTLNVGVNHLIYQAQKLLLGHKVTSSGTDITGELTANINDEGSFVGAGFYSETRRQGAKMWRALWFKKVKFSESNETFNTKSGNTSFQTPTLNGNIIADDNGDWKDETTVATEAEARSWLDAKANIAAPPSVPGVPLSFEVDPGDGKADLIWAAPSNAVTAKITGY